MVIAGWPAPWPWFRRGELDPAPGQRLAQQHLNLAIGAAKLIRRCALDGVVKRRLKAQRE